MIKNRSIDKILFDNNDRMKSAEFPASVSCPFPCIMPKSLEIVDYVHSQKLHCYIFLTICYYMEEHAVNVFYIIKPGF